MLRIIGVWNLWVGVKKGFRDHCLEALLFRLGITRFLGFFETL